MYDEDFSVLRKAALNAERMREAEVDDGAWWVGALRDEAADIAEERRGASVASAAARLKSAVKPAQRHPEPDTDPERLAALRAAYAEITSKPKCKECGSRSERMTKGLCLKCYDATYRKDRGKHKPNSYWKVYFRGYEPVMRMVQEMAKQEKRSVSEMVMIMLAEESARRLNRQVKEKREKVVRRPLQVR